jgi:hypothetical protein
MSFPGGQMSGWETIAVTAVTAGVAGAAIGASVARRSMRRQARRASRHLTLMREVLAPEERPAPAERRPKGEILALFGILGLAVLAHVRAARRRMRTRIRVRRAADPDRFGRSIGPGLDVGAGAASGVPGTAVALPDPGALGVALPPPLAPTMVRRADPAPGGLVPASLPGARWVPDPGWTPPLARTPALEIPGRDAESGPAVLRVVTAAGDVILPLPDGEGLCIGPGPADVVVPELGTELLLGRSGFVWTVQLAGPADQRVTLDGVPLTSVAMPWTSNRRLTAGAISLLLENAPPARASFDEPATDVSTDLATRCAACANAYGLAIGVGEGPYPAMLATAALAAFDPRLLDPARGAALGALNVTFAVRDSRDAHPGRGSEGLPLVAIVGLDASGELRAATNFDVSVWAITQSGVILLSDPAPEAPGALEVIPLDVHPADDLGDRPVLLLAAGAPTTVLRQRLADVTALRASPEQLTRSVVSGPGASAVAAAAVLTRPLRGSAGTRWSG